MLIFDKKGKARKDSDAETKINDNKIKNNFVIFRESRSSETLISMTSYLQHKSCIETVPFPPFHFKSLIFNIF